MIVRRGERALGGIAAAMALLAGTLALTGIAIGAAVVGPVPRVAGRPLLDVAGLVVACSWTAVGVSLILLRADHLAGWVFAVCGMAIAGSTAAQVYGATGLNQSPAWPAAAWVIPLAGLWITPFVLLTTVLLLSYPHGRIEGRPATLLARAAVMGLVVLTIGYGASPGTYQDVTPAPPPFTLPSFVTATLLFTGAVLVLPVMAGSLGWTIVRLIRARGPERQQLAWMTCVVLVFVAVFLNPVYSLPSWVETGSAIGLPVALGVGIFRHNLVTLEGVMRGGLTYGVLTVAVVSVYLACTAALGVMAKVSPLPGVLAASLAAVGLTPARARVHALVDRFLFGDRKDPLQAVSAVGGQLALADQTDLLPAVLTRITEALRSPGALVTSEDGTVLAQQGTLDTRCHHVPPTGGWGEGRDPSAGHPIGRRPVRFP